MNMLLWGFLTDPIISFYFMLRPRNVHGFSRITRQGGGTGFRSVFIHSFHFCQRSIFWAYKKCNQSNGKQSLPLNFFQGPTRQGKADKFFSIPMVSTRFFKKRFLHHISVCNGANVFEYVAFFIEWTPVPVLLVPQSRTSLIIPPEISATLQKQKKWSLRIFEIKFPMFFTFVQGPWKI